jgi:MFS family permease
MSRSRIEFAFLNLAHFYDHFLLLIFATAAALTLVHNLGMSYGDLIPYATPGFVAFAAFSIPAGWLADKWSREGMMIIFFIGIGASAALTAFADTAVEIAFGLFAIGVFAAIYHPVGLAMVVQGRERTGVPVAINGIFGNLGVAGAALATGALIDSAGWRWAFALPGLVSVLTGFAYAAFVASGRRAGTLVEVASNGGGAARIGMPGIERRLLIRLLAIIFFSTAVGGLIFQSTTFALPKILDERLGDLADTATLVGWYAFVVFSIGAFAQLAVGYLVDRHSARTVFVFVAAMQTALFAVMYQLTGFAALIVSTGFMLVVFGQLPINDVLVGRVTRSEWRSRVYALRYIVTFSVSAAALPFIGWIHVGWGFATLFVVLAVAAALILASTLLLPRSGLAIEGVPVR